MTTKQERGSEYDRKIFPAVDSTLDDVLALMCGLIGRRFLDVSVASPLENTDNITQRKHQLGAFAFVFPFVYTLFDTASMVFEGVILSDEGGAAMGEIDFLILEGLTFFVMGIAAWVYLLFVKKTLYNPMGKGEMVKATPHKARLTALHAICKQMRC